MTVPKQDRDLNHLNPMFRPYIERWLAAVRAKFPQYDVLIVETFRTRARQEYLWAQGRSGPYKRNRVVTWTQDSAHEYGLAIDWVFVNKKTRQAVWDAALYKDAYAHVPPGGLELETLAPTEYPHVQLKGGVQTARAHGIKANVIVGSKWP